MKKIAILGFGKSGQSAYRLLKSLGENVYVFDDNNIEKQDNNFYVADNKNRFYEISFDEIVVSPGISKFHPFIQYANKNSIPTISELELGYRFSQCPIIAITGTNGKTTTVALIQKIMEAAGKVALACGNYGLPISEAVMRKKFLDYLVVEVSSYQLEFINEFKPYIAAILNIGSDHIKWHGSKQEYKKAKLKIFKNQDASDYFIKSSEDDYIFSGKANLIEFSKTNRNADAFIDKDKVIVNYKNGTIIQKTKLFGKGNLENIAVSTIVSLICKIDTKIIKEVIKDMSNLENRIELIGELDGVKFYNDSKSTNIDSVINALNSFEGNNIVLILGGKHKGEPFSSLIELLKKKTKAVIVYGEDRKLIMKDLEKMIPIPLPALNVRGAMVGAFEVAAKGDIVLFSPGGSSCKPYNNYEERGKDFKKEFEKFKYTYENTPKV